MPITPGPFTGRSLTELARDLRAGTTTSAELTDLALTAIAERNPELNAFVTVDAQGARAAARRADEELAGGTDRGPLHGIPAGVKDNIDVAGLLATRGARHFAGHVAEADAACVTRLRAAGAVIAGKTTTHEYAYGPTGDRSANGPSRNPWDPARMTGGSSGGSGAAVGAGLVPLALGTDTGGSVRIPAALCGAAGFKPAFGAIPADGVFPLAPTYDHVGVLAGGAEDCLVAYECLAEAPVRRDAGPARVAWLDAGELSDGDARVTDAVRAVAGDLEEVRLPAGVAEEVRETYRVIVSCEGSEVHAERLARAPELFGPELMERMYAAATVPGWRYVRALRSRERLAEVADALFARHDVLALPAVPLTAPLIDQRELHLDGRTLAPRTVPFGYTCPWNVMRLPALTVPAGTVAGLPVGLQLVCRPGDEALLFATATRMGDR